MAEVAPPYLKETYHTVPTPKRVRARAGGRFIAESTGAKILVYGDIPHPRTYAFPRDAVLDRIVQWGEPREDRILGRVRPGDLHLDGGVIEDAAWLHEGGDDLTDHVSFSWNKVDAWYEEDEEVRVHPRDPYHRIDVLRSSREVAVEVGGVGVAETRRPVLLFETGLPVRYYIPRTDVRLDLLEPSEKRTGCPYKGTAHYRHVEVDGERHADLVWTYPAPLEGALKIDGLFAFFHERADLYVDGALQERPETPWRQG